MRTGTDARGLENHEDALADAQHGLQEARRVSEVPRQSAREMHHEQGYAYGPDPAELHLLDGKGPECGLILQHGLMRQPVK